MAKKQSTTDSPKKWHKDWGVGIRVWVESRGEIVLDGPTADLLVAVERTHSISAAARSLGISYRHAWVLIQQANERAGQPLIETAIGGERGGGTRLTDYGRAGLEVFHQIQERLRNAAARTLPQVLAKITNESTVLHLAAAISLQEVVAQIVSEYALVQPTVSVRTIFGASNELAEQIEQGGIIDLFISASKEPIDRLVKSRLIRRGARRVLAGNGLAIVSSQNFSAKIRKATDLSKLTKTQIVVADRACPLGQYTKHFLESAGNYKLLKPAIVSVENSRAVVAALRSGDSRLGIIFSSDIINAVGLKTLLEVPAANINVKYEGAAIAASTCTQETIDLLAFFQSPTAANCFRRCGFTVRNS